ncbi:MAG: hypothetical protein E6H10_06015 [Bacteroidetes bacterium]|nr:MAG: hypothetical protein E6H10_06015 [Bacteroidota bacterium]
MKTLLIRNSFATLITTAVFLSSSCKKDKMIPPTIDFTTGAGYVSADGHLAVNTAFKIGVTAKRTEEHDDLKTFIVTRSYDGGAETTIDNVTIPAAQAEEFTKDYDLTTRNQNGTEKYTFTVTNRDGLITTKSIIITVS